MTEYGPETPNGKPNGNGQKTMTKLAQDATTQVIARYAMIFAAGMLPVMGWIGTTLANRAIVSLDSMVDAQKQTDKSVNELRSDISNIKLNYSNLNERMIASDSYLSDRMTSSEKTINGRIDQLSGWSRQLSDAVDKLKEIVYPLAGRRTQ